VDQQTNTMGTVSLGLGITTVVLMFVGFCIGFIPFVSLLALFLWPLEAISATAAIATGFLGMRAAATMDGAGKGASIVGIVLGAAWYVFQLVVIGLVVVLFGFTFLLALLGAASGS
jgi:hypothetical protein